MNDIGFDFRAYKFQKLPSKLPILKNSNAHFV